MKILILEDDPKRISKFKQNFIGRDVDVTYVEEAIDAINQIKEHKFDILFLDHDLGGKVYEPIDDPNTGSEVARYINKNPIDSIVIVHSLSLLGKNNMLNLIKDSIYLPFVWEENVFNMYIPQLLTEGV